MTQTLDSTPTLPAQRAESWLHDFEEALRARDVARAAGMFAATSFWRDLISFT
jgi:putative flavoprotein involved in K+ transport